jgi:hypothetical protein
MKWVKKFEKFTQLSMYFEKWKEFAPKKITLIKGDQTLHFHRENTNCVSDLIQLNFVADERIFGDPDEMEVDIYMINNGHLKLLIDISYGDLVISEFSLESPNKVSVIEYTSYHSKFDPSNTVAAFDDETIKSFCDFFNKFDGFNFTTDDFKFLDKRDNYNPN